MESTFKKGIRTLQSELPFLKGAKDRLYRHWRRVARIPHEPDFRALRLLPASAKGCFVDVGANHGQSIESILLMRPGAEIVSFEANPMLAEELADRYRGRENIRVIAQGLSDEPGSATLFVPSYKGFVYDGLASLDRTEAAGWISDQTVFAFDSTRLEISTRTCTINTLDAFHLQPVFIKIDVQGFEYQVLRGAEETLRRCEPLLMIESFGDPKIRQFTEMLGYRECHWTGGQLRVGPPERSPNSFLVTPRWKNILGIKG